MENLTSEMSRASHSFAAHMLRAKPYRSLTIRNVNFRFHAKLSETCFPERLLSVFVRAGSHDILRQSHDQDCRLLIHLSAQVVSLIPTQMRDPDSGGTGVRRSGGDIQPTEILG